MPPPPEPMRRLMTYWPAMLPAVRASGGANVGSASSNSPGFSSLVRSSSPPGMSGAGSDMRLLRRLTAVVHRCLKGEHVGKPGAHLTIRLRPLLRAAFSAVVENVTQVAVSDSYERWLALKLAQ